MSNLIKLIGPHGTVAFATPEKAERLKTIQGYQEVSESAPEAVSEPVKTIPAKRGRPKRA